MMLPLSSALTNANNNQAAFTSTGPEDLFGLLLEAGFTEAHGKVRTSPPITTTTCYFYYHHLHKK